VSRVDWRAFVDDEFVSVQMSIGANNSSVNALAELSGSLRILKQAKNEEAELGSANSTDHIRFCATENIIAANFWRFQQGRVKGLYMLVKLKI
jgi:hypothetical protein